MAVQLRPDDETFDVIVVGAGTAGTVVASRIAENGINPSSGDRLKVGLFEGGPYYLKGGPLRPGVGDPVRRQMITNIRADETVPAKWPYDGFNVKAVGGCSLHWGSYARLPIPKDFANWQRETGVDWSEETFQEAVDEAVKMYHVHSMDEHYATPRPSTLSRPGEMFADAAKSLGLPVNQPPDPRDQGISGIARINCILCGYCGSGHYCKYDSKVTGLLYLKLIGEENGLQVIPDAEVDRVIIEKKGASSIATGIAYTQYGVGKEAHAPRVIVCCGTTGSPVLLYRSGYGPKDLLGQRAIVENDNLGRHLDGDIRGGAFRMVGLFPEDIRSPGTGSSVLVHEEGDRNKVIVSGLGGIGYPEQYPNLLALSSVAEEFGWEHKAYMRNVLKRAGTIVADVKAPIWNKGRVGLAGEHIYRRDDPAVLTLIHKAWSVARDIFSKVNPQPVKLDGPRPDWFTIGHEVGTCRAGLTKENSVVTSDFQCHDIENLLMCSAAVIPNGNHTFSHMPTVTVACYAWRRIVANHFTRGAAPLVL
ncbi:MAG: GMC family oxidoreductase [Acidobacteria bacterium]|nr:MAG: GMC family oxidoreductase [Acidobacteriota bacterium]